MAFFFPMCIFSSVLELPQLKPEACTSCSQKVNKWFFLHLPLRPVTEDGAEGRISEKGTCAFDSQRPHHPQDPSAASNDILLQSSGHFYLGILNTL